MKITSYLARFSAVAFAGFAAGVAFDFAPLALFSVASAAVVVAGLCGEYAPRVPSSRVACAVPARSHESMPLAA